MKFNTELIRRIRDNILNTKKILRETVDSNSAFLSKGTYKISPTRKIVYNKKFSKLFLYEDKNCYYYLGNWVGKQIDGTTKVSLKLASLFLNYKKTSSSSNFDGDAVLVTSNGNVIKYVNVDKRLLRSRFNSVERYNNVIQKLKIWGKFFATAPIISTDNQSLTITEKFVLKKPCSSEKKFLFILESYITAAPKLEKHIGHFTENDFIKLEEFCKELSITELFNPICEIIKTDLFVQTLTHGDSTFLNIIFDGDNYCYIDCDHVGERIFFFDVFFFLFFDSTHNNFDLLDNYVQGIYDNKLSALFEQFGLLFDPKCRFIYIFAFLYFEQILTGKFVNYVREKYKSE